MSTSTDARRKEVLRAIVADYIASQEPVGSKSLLERYQLGGSSATIRNDMAVLESQGLISSSTPAPAACPPSRATATLWTPSMRSSRFRPQSAARCSTSWKAAWT